MMTVSRDETRSCTHGHGGQSGGIATAMTMPNFLIIGANKAGTTSIYSYLKQHPQIYMSPVKEPMFFTLEGKNIDRTEVSRQITLKTAVNDIEDYQALFQGVSNEKAIGEASTAYLHCPWCAERIKQYIPDVKLIAILRDPIERAYSNYLMYVRWGLETLDFPEAVRQEETMGNRNQETAHAAQSGPSVWLGSPPECAD